MLRQLIAIFFFTGLLSQHLSRFMVLADYALNKTYIAQNLCENKNKPVMHCNGKCYLAKKLQEEDKQQAPGSQKTIPELQLFFACNSIDLQADFDILTSSSYAWYNMLYTVSYPDAVFHPPGA